MRWPGVVAFLASVLLATPVLFVLAHVTMDSEGIWGHLASTVLPRYVGNTVVLVIGVGIGTSVLGVATAWLVSMYSFPGRRFFSLALLMPLAMPTYIMAYAYTDLLEFAGPLQTFLRETFHWKRSDYWFPEIRSLGGAVVTFSFVLYPYVFMLARASFQEQSAALLEAGQTLGRGSWDRFLRIALPLARPGIVAGIALVSMETLAEYGAVDYFAVDTFTTGIYRTWEGMSSLIGANQLAALLILFVLLVLLTERLGRGSARYHQGARRYRVVARPKLRGLHAGGAVLVCAAPLMFGFVLPVGFLIQLAAGSEHSLAWGRLAEMSGNTLGVAAVTSILVVALGLYVAYVQRMQPGALASTGARLVSLGYAVPGSVIAVGVLSAVGLFDRATGWFLGGTLLGLVFAYAARFTAVALQAVEAGLERIHPSLDDAARTLGSGPLGVLRRIHGRLMAGSVLTAGLLVFVDVMKELPATMIVRPLNFPTLAVQTHHYASTERLDQSALPALLIVLVGLVPVLILSRRIDRTRGTGGTFRSVRHGTGGAFRGVRHGAEPAFRSVRRGSGLVMAGSLVGRPSPDSSGDRAKAPHVAAVRIERPESVVGKTS